MENELMEKQIRLMAASVEQFQYSLRLAALADDGVISKEEERVLKKLKKASEAFLTELNKSLE